MHTTIAIRTDDGSCPAHVFHPEGEGTWPGVLFYMDGIGMRPTLFPMGERLAAAGYYVLMPDLFYRAGEYTAADPKALFTDETVRAAWFKKVSTAASQQMITRDTQVFLAHLDASPRVRGSKIGITGYCMGGRFAIAAAGNFADRVAAAAAFHPGGLATDAPDSPHLVAGKIKARVYVAAAMEDKSFPDEQKQRLEEALTKAGVAHTLETYPARHGWTMSDTVVYDAACAERHWKALTDLFAQTLATS